MNFYYIFKNIFASSDDSNFDIVPMNSLMNNDTPPPTETYFMMADDADVLVSDDTEIILWK